MRMCGLMLLKKEMTQNEKAIEIIKKRIRVLQRRRQIDRRYNNLRAAQEYTAIIRELRHILAEIERVSRGDKNLNK